jgi:ribosomal protein L34
VNRDGGFRTRDKEGNGELIVQTRRRWRRNDRHRGEAMDVEERDTTGSLSAGANEY